MGVIISIEQNKFDLISNDYTYRKKYTYNYKWHFPWANIKGKSVKHFKCGDRLYTSESDFCRRQILTYKAIPAMKELQYF